MMVHATITMAGSDFSARHDSSDESPRRKFQPRELPWSVHYFSANSLFCNLLMYNFIFSAVSIFRNLSICKFVFHQSFSRNLPTSKFIFLQLKISAICQSVNSIFINHFFVMLYSANSFSCNFNFPQSLNKQIHFSAISTFRHLSIRKFIFLLCWNMLYHELFCAHRRVCLLERIIDSRSKNFIRCESSETTKSFFIWCESSETTKSFFIRCEP